MADQKDRKYKNEPLRDPALAARINGLLAEKGWEQADLMRAAKVSRSTVSRVCHAVRIPNARDIRQMAGALGVSTDYLLMGGDRNSAENLAPDVIEFIKKYWNRLDHSDKTQLRLTMSYIQQKVDNK